METRITFFVLRKWKSGDEESLVKNANHFIVWKFLKDSFPHPYTIDNAREWLKVVNSSEREYHMAIDVDGKAVGCIGLVFRDDVYRCNAELGYWLGPDYWNRGIMSRAVKQIVDFAFENYNINRIYARVFEGNGASVRVLEKAGFVREALLHKAVYKNDKFLDEYIFGMLRKDKIDLGI